MLKLRNELYTLYDGLSDGNKLKWLSKFFGIIHRHILSLDEATLKEEIKILENYNKGDE